MGLFSWIWKGLKRLVVLTFPAFAKARDLRNLGPRTRWAIRLLVLGIILVGLGFLNVALDLERFLHAPLPILRQVWLPLLFLLLYILIDLGWRLWKLLRQEPDASEFPDIDAAWAEAARSLDQAGIDPTETPIFLILGEPRGTEQSLFNAAKLSLQVAHVPRRPDAPLRVCADRDGIYVTCAGASLLGRQAALLNAEDDSSPAADVVAAPVPVAEPARGDLADASALRDNLLGIPATAEAKPAPGPPPKSRPTPTASPAEPVRPVPSPRAISPRPILPIDSEEGLRSTARLKHLCRLIARDRSPYCPINGILLLIPLAATDSDDVAHQTGMICRRDLDAAREVLQVHCPKFALMCDMELALGFHELVESFPEDQRQRFLGLHLPLVPALDPAEVPRMVDGAIRWIGQMLVPTLVYRIWHLEAPGREDLSEAVRQNINLYQHFRIMSEKQHRLFRILYQAFLHEPRGPILLGGFYLAGTGRDATREQAFVAGVLRRLIENQNYVSWTSEALTQDSNDRRFARYGLLAILGYLAALLTLAYAFWPRDY